MKICPTYRLTLIWFILIYRKNFVISTEDGIDGQTGPLTSTKNLESDSQKDSSKTSKNEVKRTGVLVAIDDEKSTDQWTYSKDETAKMQTYTAKEGYGFNEVKWLRSGAHCMRADRNVWKASDSSKLASKVVVKDLGYLRFDLFVYMFNGNHDVFNRPVWGSMWSHKFSFVKPPNSEPEKVTNIPSNEYPKEITVVTKGSTDSKDSKDSKQKNNVHYSVNKYHINNKPLFYEYEFVDKRECVELNYGNKTVWKYDPSKTNEQNPKSCLLFPNSKTIIFNFKDDLLNSLKPDGDQWKSVFSGKPETMALDIDDKKSTDHYTYQKSGDVGIYTAKDNHIFNTLSISSVTIWETDIPYEYCIKVFIDGIDKDTKTVTLNLLNSSCRQYNRFDKNSPWVSFDPSTRINSYFLYEKMRFKISILLKDSVSDNEDENFQNVRYPYRNIVSFNFNDKVSYFKIICNSKSVLEHKSSDSRFPKGFKIDGKYIIVYFSDKSHVYYYNETPDIFKRSDKTLLELSKTNIKFMASEKGDGSDAKELDTSKYKVYSYPFSFVYKFDEDVKCTEVKYNNDTVWKYDSSKSNQQNPKSLILDRNTDKLYLIFESIYLNLDPMDQAFAQDGHQIFKESECNIKFMTKDGSDSSKELSEDKFKKSVDEYLIEYKFNDGVKCTEVKFNNKTVWQHEQDKHKDNYPSKVIMNRYLKTINVQFNYLWYYVIKYTNNKWSLLARFEDEGKEMVTSEPSYFTGKLEDSSGTTAQATPASGGGTTTAADGTGTPPSGTGLDAQASSAASTPVSSNGTSNGGTNPTPLSAGSATGTDAKTSTSTPDPGGGSQPKSST